MTKFSTPLTEMLGIDIPILLAPMAGGPTTPELVTAVSEGGGFGQFGAAYLNGDAIREMTKKLKVDWDNLIKSTRREAIKEKLKHIEEIR